MIDKTPTVKHLYHFSKHNYCVLILHSSDTKKGVLCSCSFLLTIRNSLHRHSGDSWVGPLVIQVVRDHLRGLCSGEIFWREREEPKLNYSPYL